MCHYSEDLYDSVNHHFPNSQSWDSRNHALVIDLIDMQSRPMNFNITEYEKFIDMVLDSAWQLTFRKFTKKSIHNCLKRL